MVNYFLLFDKEKEICGLYDKLEIILERVLDMILIEIKTYIKCNNNIFSLEDYEIKEIELNNNLIKNIYKF